MNKHLKRYAEELNSNQKVIRLQRYASLLEKCVISHDSRNKERGDQSAGRDRKPKH
ncbi:MAG: hypothetical protein SOI56_06030 [Eubacteriales bacterium]|jgi:phage FluMu protein gp41